MQDFKKIETVVLLTMLAAHSTYHRRAVTRAEFIKCKTAIDLILVELASRKDPTGKTHLFFIPDLVSP